jgi:hypothetical protein
MRKTSLTGAAVGLLLLLTACSTVTHQSGDAAPAGAGASATADTPGPVTPSVGNTGTKPATNSELVPMQSPDHGWFASPSGNITCEVHIEHAGSTAAHCQTASPARSVTLFANGTYTACTGEQCLGNTGEGTFQLPYGRATGGGPFRCESASTGMTCIANGKGFQISNSGITQAIA